ncbi:MAG TPA: hypothetical protein VFW73_12425 [Lacipirellulaceae bacterium]|nr:hypothetical protein [Lacipirellulaceae bacterium]
MTSPLVMAAQVLMKGVQIADQDGGWGVGDGAWGLGGVHAGNDALPWQAFLLGRWRQGAKGLLDSPVARCGSRNF